MKQMPLVVTLAIATLVQSPFTAVADSPPLYKKERESLASHVFAGVVLQTYVRTGQQGNFVYEYGVVEVDVKRVDKGSDIAVKDRAFVKYWKKDWTGDKQNPPPDDYGQLEIPKKGDAVQVFASGDSKAGFDALSPNGFTKDEPKVATRPRSNDRLLQTTADKPTQEDAAQQRTMELQRLTTLSSMQFYTHFALLRKMLNEEWDEETFRRFSWYDGVNLRMMQGYEKQLKDNKKWGPFLRTKNALRQQVYDDLKPLIRKKRMGEELTAADVEKLVDLDKLIFEKLVK
ncbi:MAG: hypothetical protein VW875_17890 [Planctomycetaceae bacterium]